MGLVERFVTGSYSVKKHFICQTFASYEVSHEKGPLLC